MKQYAFSLDHLNILPFAKDFCGEEQRSGYKIVMGIYSAA